MSGTVVQLPVYRQERYVTLRELQAAFGYSERWWRYQLREQGFPKHRYGGHWRFLRSEVERYLHDRGRERHAG